MSEVVTKSKWTFRLAKPEDAEEFSKWAAENDQIDQKDLLAGTKAVNPTVLTFVVEDRDGKIITFAPFYLNAVLAHLGFNPEARASEKMKGLQTMLDGVAAFFVQFGVREILTMSKPEYGVAQWALTHGFEAEPRQLLKFDLNKAMKEA